MEAHAPTPAEMAALERAEELARGGLGEVEPNPRVGALLLSAGEVVAEGFHRCFGSAHAEVELFAAADLAGRSGDTLVVTLEPCSSHGKTPPCTAAVQRSGVRRVVAGALDPDPRHRGRGLEILAAAGIEVALAPGGEERLQRANAPFLAALRRERPHVVLKWAMTLDGRIAVAGGDSRWVTGPAARADVHRRRGCADAVLSGIGTLLADDCRLNPRGAIQPALGPPARIILDTGARTPPGAALLAEREGPAVIYCARDSAEERRAALERAGAQVRTIERGADDRLDLAALMADLYSRNIRRLWVEAGATLAGALFHAGLVDQVEAYIAPKVLGGRGSAGPIGGPDPPAMAAARELREVHRRSVGEDLIIGGFPAP